ncbi:alpha-helical coiled-coil protein [Staphylococcus schleiferi]|nr:alpha-helical coiled-coil protein [Staphylococcus schleiferi]
MALFLLETQNLSFAKSSVELDEKVKFLSEQPGPELIEVQVTEDLSHGYFIVESDSEAEAKQFLEDASIQVSLVKEVRLVGKDLDEIKKGDVSIDYLVTWNIPEGITMDQYLERKKKNSVHYEEVPEIQFQRTYVCEDMTKCVCLYNAPNEDAVRRAREAVDTPIDDIEKI